MKAKYKYLLTFGTAILLLGTVLQIFWSGLDSLIPTTLMTVGLVLIVNGVFRHLKYGEVPERDERTRKISAFAIAYSWLVTMIFIAVLIWLDHFNLLKDFPSSWSWINDLYDDFSRIGIPVASQKER